MTGKEKIKKYLTAVNEDKKNGVKINLLNIKMIENFEDRTSIVIACFNNPERNDITYEAELFYENGINGGYWLCEDILSTSSQNTWRILNKEWHDKGFIETIFINF